MQVNQTLANMTALGAGLQAAGVLYFATRTVGVFIESARKSVSGALLLASTVVAIEALRQGGAPDLYVEWVGFLVVAGVSALLVDGRLGLKGKPLVVSASAALMVVWASDAVERAWGNTASGFGVAFGLRLIYLMPVLGSLRLLLTVMVVTIGWANSAMARPSNSREA